MLGIFEANSRGNDINKGLYQSHTSQSKIEKDDRVTGIRGCGIHDGLLLLLLNKNQVKEEYSGWTQISGYTCLNRD